MTTLRAASGADVPPAVWTVMAVGTGCVVAALAATGWGSTPAAWRIATALLLLAAGNITFLHIRFGADHHSFALAEVALVAAVVLVPLPWLVLIAAVGSAAAHATARRSPVKIAFNALSFAAGAALAGAVWAIVVSTDGSPLAQAQGLLLASLAFHAWNSTTATLAVAASQGLPFGAVYRTGLLLSVFMWAGNTAVGVLLVLLATSRSALVAGVPGLLLLLWLVYRSYLRSMKEADTWRALEATSRELLHAEPSRVAEVVLHYAPILFPAELVELVLSEGDGGGGVFRKHRRQDTVLSGASSLDWYPGWPGAAAGSEPFATTTATAPARQRAALQQLGLTSCTIAPLVAHGRFLGSLRLGFAGRAGLSARELQVLATFANHVSAAVDGTQLLADLRSRALSDPLTGLANRTVILDLLERPAADAPTRGTALIFIDLDRFKLINDSLGHEAGDLLLVGVADRLRTNLRPGDTAARLGGDEFVVLCQDVGTAAQALDIAERLAAELAAPFWLQGQEVSVSASFGVSLSEQGSAGALLRDADTAMYQAKFRGRARCELFDEALREEVVGRLRLEGDLRGALERGELRLDYQPFLSLEHGEMVGTEALLRWDHPTLGAVPPTQFIGIAEETGLIMPIGSWVVEEACRQLAEWVEHRTFGDVPPHMSINLSPLQLTQPSLVADIAAVTAALGLDPALLCFEVTEGALASDMDGAMEVLARLRALGARTALDDFGTGYSSLSYLRLLPVDVLKLDRSFVSRLSTHARDRAVVAGMVDLAHALDLTVIAEGVETGEQVIDLRALACDVAQGYHFSRPCSAGELERAMGRGARSAA